jgi:hypothetical protein
MKVQLKFFFLLLFVFSCKKYSNELEDYQTLRVDIKKVAEKNDFEDIFDAMTLVTLQLPENKYIGVISDLKYYEGMYFLLDNKSSSIFIFDKDGVMLNTIDQRGEGPNEYYGINFFDINRKLGSIDIMDIRRGRIMRFDLDGNFLENHAARVICRDFAITSSGEYLFYCPDEPINPEHSIKFNSGVVSLSLDKGYKYLIELGDPAYLPIITGKSFFEAPDGVGLLTTYSDTLYLIGPNSQIDKTFIDYGVKIDEAAFSRINFDFMEANFPFLKFFPAYLGNGYYYYFTAYKEKILSIVLNPSVEEVEVFFRWDSEENKLFIPFRGFGTGGQYIVPIDQEMILQVRSYYTTEEPSNEEALKSLSLFENKLHENSGNPLLLVLNPKKSN